MGWESPSGECFPRKGGENCCSLQNIYKVRAKIQRLHNNYNEKTKTAVKLSLNTLKRRFVEKTVCSITYIARSVPT